jgi:NADH:ubiquinone oxidoreductase subunit 5 (subunit L)/multisubunit Na+/H+ antiporter MnhA subunit
VAFHHNIPLWVVASVYTAFLCSVNVLNILQSLEERRTKHHLHESPSLKLPLIVLAILATMV